MFFGGGKFGRFDRMTNSEKPIAHMNLGSAEDVGYHAEGSFGYARWRNDWVKISNWVASMPDVVNSSGNTSSIQHKYK